MPSMNQRTDLKEALGRLARSLPREAGEGTRTRLLGVVRARRMRSRRIWMYWSAAAACLILSLGWAIRSHFAQPVPVDAASTSNLYGTASGFWPLPYSQSDVPMESAVVVRVKIAPAEVAAMGVPALSTRVNGQVSADLLVGQDGVARAVRLVE